VWVGIIALLGLAAQTGIVMIVYIDNAYERHKREGRIHNLSDIVAAHMEGTVQRVRPKLMTVTTMLLGLVPLLWATSSGADVMKRIAAPMVGGLLSSAFLTLEIIPVIATYWRQEELLWERCQALAPAVLRPLRLSITGLAFGAVVTVAMLLTCLYVAVPRMLALGVTSLGLAIFFGSMIAYAWHRPAVRTLVWPGEPETARLLP
jgi:copper/silver efflux system protein